MRARARGLVGAWLLSLVLSPAAPALGPPASLTPAEAARLVEQLGARSFLARQTAEAWLRARGMVALPALRKAAGHRDPEVRRRALALLPALEQAALMAPKRLTFRAENLTLEQLLAKVSQASGYEVGLTDDWPTAGGPFFPAVPQPVAGQAEAGRRYNYAFTNATFWEVMDRVCGDARLVVVPRPGESLRVYQTTRTSPFTCTDGGFRTFALGLEQHRAVDLLAPVEGKAGPKSARLTLSLGVSAEPRLRVLGVGRPRLEAAYDDRRKSMLPTEELKEEEEAMKGPPRRGRFPRGRLATSSVRLHAQVSVRLERHGDRATALKRVSGLVPVTVEAHQGLVTITDQLLKARGTRKAAGDVTFEISTVLKHGDEVVLRLQVVATQGPDFDAGWLRGLGDRLQVQDARGVTYEITELSTDRLIGPSAQGQLSLTCSAPAGVQAGPPARLVYQNWVRRQHLVRFELRDMPLP